ncbi:hypothetical protein AU196_02790 [Mycobacterium sp. IS-1742]|uniref:hypothetical protein n=1 Tax=Mycobacterium sp. IS-1742 TaxID=1772285 RepID=UPI000740069D|nr:hypothetical protein [Mycobacterium sp. IS-1742]KUI26556.1 hypothetical protein AU196_02790 [Mycobacterium sp. IS-1742]
MSEKICKECRTRQPVAEFPADRWGRPDTRQCLQCVDENTPLLMTRVEAAKHLGVTQDDFDRLGLAVAGSYAPPKRAAVARFARADFP